MVGARKSGDEAEKSLKVCRLANKENKNPGRVENNGKTTEGSDAYPPKKKSPSLPKTTTSMNINVVPLAVEEIL